jgi:hypothetical protein
MNVLFSQLFIVLVGCTFFDLSAITPGAAFAQRSSKKDIEKLIQGYSTAKQQGDAALRSWYQQFDQLSASIQKDDPVAVQQYKASVPPSPFSSTTTVVGATATVPKPAPTPPPVPSRVQPHVQPVVQVKQQPTLTPHPVQPHVQPVPVKEPQQSVQSHQPQPQFQVDKPEQSYEEPEPELEPDVEEEQVQPAVVEQEQSFVGWGTPQQPQQTQSVHQPALPSENIEVPFSPTNLLPPHQTQPVQSPTQPSLDIVQQAPFSPMNLYVPSAPEPTPVHVAPTEINDQHRKEKAELETIKTELKTIRSELDQAIGFVTTSITSNNQVFKYTRCNELLEKLAALRNLLDGLKTFLPEEKKSEQKTIEELEKSAVELVCRQVIQTAEIFKELVEPTAKKLKAIVNLIQKASWAMMGFGKKDTTESDKAAYEFFWGIKPQLWGAKGSKISKVSAPWENKRTRAKAKVQWYEMKRDTILKLVQEGVLALYGAQQSQSLVTDLFKKYEYEFKDLEKFTALERAVRETQTLLKQYKENLEDCYKGMERHNNGEGDYAGAEKAYIPVLNDLDRSYKRYSIALEIAEKKIAELSALIYRVAAKQKAQVYGESFL